LAGQRLSGDSLSLEELFYEEASMNKLCFLLGVFCLSVFVASAVMAADTRTLAIREGVEASIQYDPLGPNNQIVAYVSFINKNQYKVEVSWQSIIICEDDYKREGPITSMSINEGDTYVVNIWRTSACVYGRIKDFSVNMEVKKANR
jgi:hypothetical protein